MIQKVKPLAWFLAVMLALPVASVEARGGRGGGGFHGGGGARGGGGMHAASRPAANRSPSLSRPQQVSRPSGAGLSRPAIGGGNAPGVSTRPSLPNRPSISSRPNTPGRPGQPDLPGAGNRPNIAQRPNLPEGNRPGFDGNRPGVGNRPGRPGDGGNLAGRPGNRPGNNHWDNHHINHDYWQHGRWHDNWNYGWYNRPSAWWWGGFATGAIAASIPWSWGYWSYTNPYAAQPIVVNNVAYDYSQPLAASDTYADDAVPAGQPTPAELAANLFDTARQAFYQGDYETALAKVNEAIAQAPDDATLHEFRALCWFATGNYKESAAALYAVLSAGPGWDWTTLSGLYPSTDVYTKQLRALESYVEAHPQEPQAHFVLAYHYLTCGQTDAAKGQLQDVVRLNPQDTLSAQLLASLVPPAEQPAPAATPPAPAAPAAPITAATLAGNWKASQPDGTTIALRLGKDSQYVWSVSRNKQQQEFSGKYTVADNLLVLNQDGNPAMVGQVADATPRGFNFRLPGAAPSDPGLSFTK